MTLSDFYVEKESTAKEDEDPQYYCGLIQCYLKTALLRDKMDLRRLQHTERQQCRLFRRRGCEHDG